MKKSSNYAKNLFSIFSLVLCLLLGSCWRFEKLDDNSTGQVQEDEYYYERDEVAAYIDQFQDLPDNYISKKEASANDWEPSPDAEFVVGGDKFGNREGKLPKAKGRQYFEADLREGYTNDRGASRLVYSNDGLVFYTDDHYESFEQLY